MKRLLVIVLALACISPIAFGQANTDLKGTITCWTWAPALKSVYNGFKKLYPNINLEITPMSWSDAHDKVLVAMASGSGAPDLLTIDCGYIQKFIDQGGLVDMTDFMNPIKDKFPSFKVTNDSDSAGHVFAVPFDVAPVGYFYQKSIVDKYKIALPETWSDFIALGKQLKSKGIYMNTVSVAASSMDQSLHGEVGLLGLLTQQQGGSWFDADLKPTLNTKEVVTAMKLIKEMVDSGVSANESMGSPSYQQGYADGKILGVVSGAWYVNALNDFVKPGASQWGNWRVALMPAFTKGGVRASNLGGSELAIPEQISDSQKKLAMTFIKYACASLEGAKVHADSNELPAYLPAYTTDIIQNKTFDVMGDQKVYKMLAQVAPKVPMTWRIPPKYAQIQSILQAKMNAILTGKVSVEKGLQEAQDEALSK
jgi:ABC-type glycerol-3-phosphate transport system substrate-binding protein